jgi:hypothetical protein
VKAADRKCEFPSGSHNWPPEKARMFSPVVSRIRSTASRLFNPMCGVMTRLSLAVEGGNALHQLESNELRGPHDFTTSNLNSICLARMKKHK